jgi:multiple sugar transport system ATP-binding protein
MVAGLDTPTSGEIRIAGRVVNDLPPKERNISMVFQTYALYPHMNVEANMGFGLKIAKEKAAAIRSRVRSVAGMLGLENMLDRLPRQLSGGQRQRVAMGRAMVRNPAVFLFDEPLSNLDAKLRVQMRAEIRALHERLKTTSIYVTHDQIEAMTMADRIVVLRDGRVEQAGTPEELYDCPANTFVGTFIGSPSMNLLNGKLDAGRGIAHLAEHAVLNLDMRRLHSTPADVVLGFRPEHARISALHEPGTIAATVRAVEFTGADTLVSCACAGAAVQVMLRGKLKLAAGAAIGLALPPEQLHVFDAGTTARISTQAVLAAA